jgi:hypothetical protein
VGNLLRIVFALIFLIAICYLAILGLNAFFDWLNPGGDSGRIARITTGVVLGLGVTIAVIAFRRFFRGS